MFLSTEKYTTNWKKHSIKFRVGYEFTPHMISYPVHMQTECVWCTRYLLSYVGLIHKGTACHTDLILK